MSNLKYKLEALLFSSARSMKIEELSSLANASPEEVRETLNKLKEDYEKRDSSIALIDEGNSFKLNVKSEHASSVNQVVTETELSKTLMETLAVIAFKYPIKQSELIKIRTNKAYDHLKELDEMGYIIRQKFGRTKLIKLTPKFFEYFDLPQEKLKEKFQDFGGIAKAIKEKEEEIKQINDDMKKKAKEAGKNKEQPEVDLVDDEGHKEKLEVYEKTESEQEAEESKEVKPYIEKVGDLEVTDVPEKEESEEIEDELEPEEGIEMTESMGEKVLEKIKAEIKGEASEEKEEEEKTSEEVESEVDKRVEELLHPKETEEETNQEEPPQEETTEETEQETTEEQEQQETPEDNLEEQPDEEPAEENKDQPKDLLDAEEEEKKE